jgi:hypothetical protein
VARLALIRRAKKQRLAAFIADRLVLSTSGEPLHPQIARERQENRERIRKAQEAERGERKREPQISPTGRYHWPEERNALVDSYQDTIRRIVSIALRRGVPERIERADLEQRLNIALIEALDTYTPRPGVTLNAYIWELLNQRLATAINEENKTDGMTWKPDGAGRAFQLYVTYPCDVGRAGRRATAHIKAEAEDRETVDVVRGGAKGLRAEDEPRGNSSSPMVSWGAMGYRDMVRVTAVRLKVE